MHTEQPARRSHLKGWSWALSAQTVQLVVQALSLALLARALPVNDLGLLVSLTAITTILAPFVGIGAPNLLIREVGRDPQAFQQQWSNLVFSTLLSGPFVCLVAIAIAFAVLPRSVPAWEIGCVDLRKPGFDDRVEWERQQLKKLRSIPLVGDDIFRLARRFLRRWTGGFGLR
jgi:hypothetical protein